MTQPTNDNSATHLRLLEALLFASPEPLALAVVQARLGEGVDARALVAELCFQYRDRGIVLMETGGGFAFRTAPDLAPLLHSLAPIQRKLSRAALETLAIVAYHQPATRAEIESIRGVATSSGTLDALMAAGWIKPGKRRDSPGRPGTWVTTPQFLAQFSLSSLADLPNVDELRASGLLDARPVLGHLPEEDSVEEEE